MICRSARDAFIIPYSLKKCNGSEKKKVRNENTGENRRLTVHIRRRFSDMSGSAFEQIAHKGIHMRTDGFSDMVAALHIMPDMIDAVFIQQIMIGNRCLIDHGIIRTGCDHQQIGFAVAEPELIFCNHTRRDTRCRTHCTDVSEQIRAHKSDIE